MSLLAETSFAFFDPFELSAEMIDGELQLVPPQEPLIDEMVAACQHPLTRAQMPRHAESTHSTFHHFLQSSPNGLTVPDPMRGLVPTYTFWMRVFNPDPFTQRPAHLIAGACSLRIAHTPNIELYLGHVGYHVFPMSRGNHYAGRACRMLSGIARRHGFRSLWITCNSDNVASRRTCERLGARLVGVLPVPKENALYSQGDREKCRYRLEIPPIAPRQ